MKIKGIYQKLNEKEQYVNLKFELKSLSLLFFQFESFHTVNTLYSKFYTTWFEIASSLKFPEFNPNQNTKFLYLYL